MVRITKLPETQAKLPGFAWIGSSPHEFGAFVKANIERIGNVVRQAEIKGE